MPQNVENVYQKKKSTLFAFALRHNERNMGADASVEMPKLHNIKLLMATHHNESTAGADASVDVPKLHNIKLLIASFYHRTVLSMLLYHNEHFCMQSQGNLNSG